MWKWHVCNALYGKMWKFDIKCSKKHFPRNFSMLKGSKCSLFYEYKPILRGGYIWNGNTYKMWKWHVCNALYGKMWKFDIKCSKKHFPRNFSMLKGSKCSLFYEYKLILRGGYIWNGNTYKMWKWHVCNALYGKMWKFDIKCSKKHFPRNFSMLKGLNSSLFMNIVEFTRGVYLKRKYIQNVKMTCLQCIIWENVKIWYKVL